MNALFLFAALLLSLPPEQTDSATLFERGITFDQFLATAQQQKEVWRANVARTHVSPELVDRLKKAGTDLHLLVITEAYCTDSVHIVPYLAGLASLAGVELRIVSKAAGLAIARAHPTPDGRAATPTVVLLRKRREVGAWVERPAVLQAWYLAMTGKLDPRDRESRKVAWYDWDRGDTSLGEIVALAEKRD